MVLEIQQLPARASVTKGFSGRAVVVQGGEAASGLPEAAALSLQAQLAPEGAQFVNCQWVLKGLASGAHAWSWQGFLPATKWCMCDQWPPGTGTCGKGSKYLQKERLPSSLRRGEGEKISPGTAKGSAWRRVVDGTRGGWQGAARGHGQHDKHRAQSVGLTGLFRRPAIAREEDPASRLLRRHGTRCPAALSHRSWPQDTAAAAMTAGTLAVLWGASGRWATGALPPASLQGEPGTHFLSSTQSQALRLPEEHTSP